MNTVILMWNPSISSFKKEEFRHFISIMRNHDEDGMPFYYDEEDNFRDDTGINWSIWDYENVSYGDRFFMVRVGEGKTGIVMAGSIMSEPYKDEDWSGKGREVYYSDLFCECMIDSDAAPYISTKELEEAMPDFDWSGGHSGRVLDETTAEKLEVMWAEYLYKYFGIFDNKRCGRAITASFIPETLLRHVKATSDCTCEICGYNFQKIWGEDCNFENMFVRYVPRRSDVRAKNGDTFMQHIHCVCPNCGKMSYDKLADKLGEKDYYPDASWDDKFSILD